MIQHCKFKQEADGLIRCTECQRSLKTNAKPEDVARACRTAGNRSIQPRKCCQSPVPSVGSVSHFNNLNGGR